MFLTLCLIILYIPLLIIFPTRVTGKKNIPKKGRVIFCTNHQTLADPVIIAYKLTRRRFKYMAKKPLFKNKLLGPILKGLVLIQLIIRLQLIFKQLNKQLSI